MSRIKDWFEYYFIRKKAPLSYILYSDILKREMSIQGVYGLELASKSDCAITLNSGTPKENKISINIYDGKKLIDTVDIRLSYRSMQKIKKGFNEAWAISNQAIKELK